MQKFIISLFAGSLLGASCIALAVEAQPMDESTHPNRGTDMPTENMQQKPDRSGTSATSGRSRTDREHMDRWDADSGSGSAGSRGTNNPNSNSDVSGGDQIERGADKDPNKLEKLRQKPNPEPQ
jgi:hypothetical protein